MEKIISIKNLTYAYQNETIALNNINLDIYKGEWVSIVGHNGSGKSTLSKLIIGLLEKQTGEIIVDGLNLNEENLYDIRSKIGIVFQNPDNQFVGATVQDDIAFGLENHGVPREEMIKRIEMFAKKVNMESFLRREPHLLSGGQKQRVAIAGVLAMMPEIIILDEATSMLDPKGRMEIINTIRDLYDSDNITIISITHDLEEAALSDRIIVLNKGEIENIDTPRNIFKNEQRLIEIGLDIPFSIKVSNALNINVALTKEELVMNICE